MTVEIGNFNLNPLNQKQLLMVNLDSKNSEWFSTNFQSRTQKKSPEYYSLRTLIESVKNSEETFEQFPVDEKSIKEIARSIFIESFWLQRDISLGIIDGTLYIIGGRHRVSAIANTLAQAVRFKHQNFAWSDQHLVDVFNGCLDMFIRCDVTYLSNKEDLLTLIASDNESRRMRKAEYGHLLSQSYGADADSLSSITDTLLSSDLSPKEAVTIAAQNFVRRSSRLKPQTRQILGEKVAKHLLYGTAPDRKLAVTNKVLITSKKEFEYLMDRAWEILERITKDAIAVAKNVTALAKEITDELDNQRVKDSLVEVVTVEPAPQETLAEPITAVRGSRKLAKV